MSHQLIFAATELQDLLRISAVTELRSIELDCTGDQLVLRGVVGSFYYKQMAQELVRKGAEGLKIENEIRVEYSESPDLPDWQDARETSLLPSAD